MREETEKRDLLLSLTHLFLLSYTLCLVYLCMSCVLGYGWKRLDFDMQEGLSSYIYRTGYTIVYVKFSHRRSWFRHVGDLKTRKTRERSERIAIIVQHILATLSDVNRQCIVRYVSTKAQTMPNLYSIPDRVETYKISIYKYYMYEALGYSMMHDMVTMLNV